MHEASIVEALVKVVVGEASSRGITRVRAIDLVVGEVTGYMKESLDFYFDIMAKETVAEGAVLRARYISPTLLCEKCGAEFARARFSFDCPRCGGPGKPSGKGEEFYVESMEADCGDEDDQP